MMHTLLALGVEPVDVSGIRLCITLLLILFSSFVATASILEAIGAAKREILSKLEELRKP